MLSNISAKLLHVAVASVFFRIPHVHNYCGLNNNIPCGQLQWTRAVDKYSITSGLSEHHSCISKQYSKFTKPFYILSFFFSVNHNLSTTHETITTILHVRRQIFLSCSHTGCSSKPFFFIVFQLKIILQKRKNWAQGLLFVFQHIESYTVANYTAKMLFSVNHNYLHVCTVQFLWPLLQGDAH